MHFRAENMNIAANPIVATQPDCNLSPGERQWYRARAPPVRPALRASLLAPPPLGRPLPPHSCVSSCTCRSAAFTSWLIDSVDRKGWGDGRRRCGRRRVRKHLGALHDTKGEMFRRSRAEQEWVAQLAAHLPSNFRK